MSFILSWLSANWGTIVVCALLLAMVSGLIYKLIRDKKRGKSSCCGGCSGCAMQGTCHQPSPTNPSDPTEHSDHRKT